MTPIIKQLITLEHGVQLDVFENKNKFIKFFTIFGIFDKPARRDILNIIGSNGFFGCIRCLQPGSTETTEKNGYYYSMIMFFKNIN